MDFVDILKGLAPTAATLIGGPFAGLAVKFLGPALGLSPEATAATGTALTAIQDTLTKGQMTADQVVAIKQAELQLQQHMADNGIKLEELKVETVKVEAADRADARKNNSTRDAAWWIASLILLTFAAMMAAVLYGCWQLLQGGITIKDVSTVAAISGLVGSVVGYVAANAQTVVNFIYGGSADSTKHADAMASAVQQAMAGKG